MKSHETLKVEITTLFQEFISPLINTSPINVKT
jgi:hypothetical protein